MEELFARMDFAQRFELISSLGTGATVVYLANDTYRDQTVVLKFIDLPAKPEQQQVLLKAVREALRIRSEFVVRTYEVVSAKTCICLVMEHVAGKTLAELVTPGQALAVDEVTTILKSIVRGLSAIHRNGLVHRDLKLDNVLVSDSGVAKIVDLGLMSPTQVVDRTPEAGTWIHTAEWISGTPAMLPPEYFRAGKFDDRSDLYALGCMAYELVTGFSPFPQKSFLGLVQVKLKNLYPAVLKVCADCPPFMATWITRLLESDPNLRFQSCAEALEGLSSGAVNSSCVVSTSLIPPFPVRREIEKVLSVIDRTGRGKWFVKHGEELLSLSDDALRRTTLSVIGTLVVCGLMLLAAIVWLEAGAPNRNAENFTNTSDFNSHSLALVHKMSECGASFFSDDQPRSLDGIAVVDSVGLICSLRTGGLLTPSQTESPIQEFALVKSRWPKQEICRVNAVPSDASCLVSGTEEIDLPVSDGEHGVYFVKRDNEQGVRNRSAEVWHQSSHGRRQVTSLHRPISAMLAAEDGKGVFLISPDPEGSPSSVLFYSSAKGQEKPLVQLGYRPTALVYIAKKAR